MLRIESPLYSRDSNIWLAYILGRKSLRSKPTNQLIIDKISELVAVRVVEGEHEYKSAETQHRTYR